MGVGINTAEWTSRAARRGGDFPALAAAMLANGDTLVVASGAPKPDSAIAAEFRSPCELDAAFGQGGATRLANPGPGVSVSEVLPTADGGAVIAGSTSQTYRHFLVGPSHWLVGKLTADGQLDTSFGSQGWVTLPWAYTATSLALASNGNIVVGGDGKTSGSSFISELTTDGKLVPTFGVAGRTRMPPWHDGGVQGVWIEPTGDILSLVGGGNMGCWGLTAVTLTANGVRVPDFTKRFMANLRRTEGPGGCFSPVFIGDVTIGSAGFHLIGTGQRSCVNYGCTERPGRRDPTAHLSDLAFAYTGALDSTFGTSGRTSFPAPIAGSAWAFPQTDGSLLLATSPVDIGFGNHPNKHAHLRLYRISPTGDLQTSYANNGVADVPLPFVMGSADTGAVQSLPVSNGKQNAIVTSTTSGNALILISAPT